MRPEFCSFVEFRLAYGIVDIIECSLFTFQPGGICLDFWWHCLAHRLFEAPGLFLSGSELDLVFQA